VSAPLASLPDKFSYRLDLSGAATPRLLKRRPLHRWFYFPHSYSPELVDVILDSWGLPADSSLVDPFVGAGTTLVVAKERGHRAIGTDLSPLAILLANAKVADYDPEALRSATGAVVATVASDDRSPGPRSPRMTRALTDSEFAQFWKLSQAIVKTADPCRDFLLVALVGIVSRFSRAVSDGGWFRWLDKPEQAHLVLPTFSNQVDRMLADVEPITPSVVDQSPPLRQKALLHDARSIHSLGQVFDGLITSPPYPNRHDYTRVFQIELLLLGSDEDEVFRIRHNSLRSHVEAAAPPNADLGQYSVPPSLHGCLDEMPVDVDPRVPRMVRGYFEDMYLSLLSARRCVRPGGNLALVVGNVRHAGVVVPVDEILAEVGEEAGLQWTRTCVIRLRGNSAQQMGTYGRVPSREGIVFFRVPEHE
jgi:hypothetical protein